MKSELPTLTDTQVSQFLTEAVTITSFLIVSLNIFFVCTSLCKTIAYHTHFCFLNTVIYLGDHDRDILMQLREKGVGKLANLRNRMPDSTSEIDKHEFLKYQICLIRCFCNTPPLQHIHTCVWAHTHTVHYSEARYSIEL